VLHVHFLIVIAAKEVVFLDPSICVPVFFTRFLRRVFEQILKKFLIVVVEGESY